MCQPMIETKQGTDENSRPQKRNTIEVSSRCGVGLMVKMRAGMTCKFWPEVLKPIHTRPRQAKKIKCQIPRPTQKSKKTWKKSCAQLCRSNLPKLLFDACRAKELCVTIWLLHEAHGDGPSRHTTLGEDATKIAPIGDQIIVTTARKKGWYRMQQKRFENFADMF